MGIRRRALEAGPRTRALTRHGEGRAHHRDGRTGAERDMARDVARIRRSVQMAGRRSPIWRSYRVGLLLLRTLYIINRERTRVVRAHARGDAEARPNVG